MNDAATAPPFEIVEQRDVTVVARDGTRLATNVYLPGRGGRVAEGRFPAIVRRTPYGKDLTLRRGQFWRFFVPKGYACVVQDVRGRYGSGGHWDPLRQGGADRAGLLALVAAPPRA